LIRRLLLIVFSLYRTRQHGSFSGYGAPSTSLTRSSASTTGFVSRSASCSRSLSPAYLSSYFTHHLRAIPAETPVGFLQPTCYTAVQPLYRWQTGFPSFRLRPSIQQIMLKVAINFEKKSTSLKQYRASHKQSKINEIVANTYQILWL